MASNLISEIGIGFGDRLPLRSRGAELYATYEPEWPDPPFVALPDSTFPALAPETQPASTEPSEELPP